MDQFIFSFTLVVLCAFLMYWYIKFGYILPIERRTSDIEKAFSNFTSFSREVLEHIYVPESVEHYGDIANYYLVKIHKVFPDSSILVFEFSESRWKLINYLKNFKTEPKLMTAYQLGVFDKCAADGELVRLDRGVLESSPDAAALFRIFGIGSAIAVPFMQTGGQARRILLCGNPSPGRFDASGAPSSGAERIGGRVHPEEPYLRFVAAQLNAVNKTSEKLLSAGKEREQLRIELNAVLRELDMAGSRLIRGAKERKALYEVVTKVSGEETDVNQGTAAILNVVAKMVDADVVACLLFDESRNELVVSPGSFGIPDEERMRYSIPVGNAASSSVQAFLSRKPFITPDAQNDAEVQPQYAKLWNIRSLMVVPIALHNRIIGVLRVGSRRPDFFTQDQLEFLAIIADELAIIIEMITLYENVSETAKELAQLNKLKDEFLTTVSHELKTPLTTIKGFISVILSGEVGPLNEQQTNFLTVTDQATNRLTHLISNLLDLSRLNGKVEMEFAVISLKDLIRNSASGMLIKARETGISLSSSVDKDLPPVYADARWISQVVDNLLINAIKYSGPGAKVCVSGSAKGEVAVVCVEDNGPGVPVEEQKLIFDKFYRGKTNARQVPGTGLGLAISKSVVEKHGGKIWLESKPGAGSRFLFALPVAKLQHGPAPTEAADLE
jgi:signal transduction histidine kinase